MDFSQWKQRLDWLDPGRTENWICLGIVIEPSKGRPLVKPFKDCGDEVDGKEKEEDLVIGIIEISGGSLACSVGGEIWIGTGDST